jgi:hypothetical protein
MREILFRGKSKKTNTWAYGYFVESEGACFIYSKNENLRWVVTEVIPESVGQFIGVIDTENKKVFEGDIAENESFKEGEFQHVGTINTDEVAFSSGRFYIKGFSSVLHWHEMKLKVVGNTTDNPDLIPE